MLLKRLFHFTDTSGFLAAMLKRNRGHVGSMDRLIVVGESTAYSTSKFGVVGELLFDICCAVW